MATTPLQVLQATFGYDGFRGFQAEIIDWLIAGGDALVLMPTGGGKSLCYQIPALLRPGTGVVVSPLIALMQDQVEALKQLGVNAAFLNSSLGLDDQRRIERQFLDGALDLLYVAPERLTTERFLAALEQTRVSLFAIDEAHCVSQWGHDFRTDYLKLSLLHSEPFRHVPRIALTATADERTRQEIVVRLGLEEARVFCSGFDRPNIRYTITSKHDARDQLLQFLRAEHSGDAGIAYCLSRKKVEETAAYLNSQGCTALPYHAGLSSAERQRNQRRFLMEDGVIVVATIAFGMGIDKPNVRFVAHLDLPRSLEAYYQETGRAGRDGLPADAWMVYGLQDVITQRRMVEESDAHERHKQLERQKLESMLGFCELVSCRRQTLLRYFGEELTAPCGNCDNCLSPPMTWDGTEAARKALSCVYRTNQRFGAGHVVDVLLGKTNDRTERLGHHQLSTFGIGKELDKRRWLSVIRQLVTGGFLTVDHEAYGALKLTEICRPVLRGETVVSLRRDEARAPARRKPAGGAVPAGPDDGRLWESLRALRKKLADQQGVPPYVIFHDSVLLDMVQRRPRSLPELGGVSGIGERKLERYGEDFLAEIRSHVVPATPKPPLTGTVEESLKLFWLGLGIGQIAERRALKTSTIYDHLAVAIAAGLVDAKDVVRLEPSTSAEIHRVWLALPEPERRGLSHLYEAFQGRFEYGVLRCLRAAWERQGGPG